MYIVSFYVVTQISQMAQITLMEEGRPVRRQASVSYSILIAINWHINLSLIIYFVKQMIEEMSEGWLLSAYEV
jgi:hypothetical protein